VNGGATPPVQRSADRRRASPSRASLQHTGRTRRAAELGAARHFSQAPGIAVCTAPHRITHAPTTPYSKVLRSTPYRITHAPTTPYSKVLRSTPYRITHALRLELSGPSSLNAPLAQRTRACCGALARVTNSSAVMRGSDPLRIPQRCRGDAVGGGRWRLGQFRARQQRGRALGSASCTASPGSMRHGESRIDAARRVPDRCGGLRCNLWATPGTMWRVARTSTCKERLIRDGRKLEREQRVDERLVHIRVEAILLRAAHRTVRAQRAPLARGREAKSDPTRLSH
jgi:hypothetical protein